MTDPTPIPPVPPYGDMPPEEFRRHAHSVVDWMADYLASVGEYPVLAQVQPGEVAARLPASAPESGEEVEEILRDAARRARARRVSVIDLASRR